MHENPFNSWLDAVDDRLGLRLSRVLAPLLTASVIGCGIIFWETYVAHRARQLYLIKNLFLAWLPLIFAFLWFRMQARAAGSKWWLGLILLACWLFFLPNSPYVFTDLIHSFGRSGDRIWTDMVKISLFAFTGLCVGHVSLALVHKVVRDRWGWVLGWGFVVVISGLSSLGVWLGRFRRWNTWDLLHRPSGIFEDTIELAQGVYLDPSGGGFLVLMFLLIFFSYLMLHAMRHGHYLAGPVSMTVLEAGEVVAGEGRVEEGAGEVVVRNSE